MSPPSLKNQGEWVFGDYVQVLSKRRLRLLMRQLHRVIASLLDRALAPTEVQRFFRLARAAKKWAQNAGDFKKVIDDIVQLSKTPVAPAASRSKSSDGAQDSAASKAPCPSRASCQPSTTLRVRVPRPVTWLRSRGGEECQMGASGKRGVDLAPLEVAD